LLVASRLPLALTVLAAAAVSDVLDGWAARRHRPAADHERHRGDWLDPFCDKVFVAAMLSGIYVVHHPPVKLLLLVVTRELLQGCRWPSTRSSLAAPRASVQLPRAYPGQGTTVAQFLTAAALLLDQPASRPLAVVCSLLGLATMLVYVNRARALPRPVERKTRAPAARERTSGGGSGTVRARPAHQVGPHRVTLVLGKSIAGEGRVELDHAGIARGLGQDDAGGDREALGVAADDPLLRLRQAASRRPRSAGAGLDLQRLTARSIAWIPPSRC